MADFWVTQQRHWCKYCKKFIQNNKPSIQLHESGDAHKNQVQRFLRDVYKKGQQEKKESENVRRELQRIERAAQGKYRKQDMPTGAPHITPTQRSRVDSRPSSSSSVTRPSRASAAPVHSATAPPPPPPPGDDFSFYPHEGPVQQGRDEWVPATSSGPGKWERVELALPPAATAVSPSSQAKSTTGDKQLSTAQDDDDEDADPEDLRNFKIREKEYPKDAYTDEHEQDTKEDSSNVDTSSLFKKRKASTLSGSGKKRNIRKKD